MCLLIDTYQQHSTELQSIAWPSFDLSVPLYRLFFPFDWIYDMDGARSYEEVCDMAMTYYGRKKSNDCAKL